MSGMSVVSAMASESVHAALVGLAGLGFNEIKTAGLLKLHYLFKAREFSFESKDPSLRVGAIIVQDNKIIAGGYNHFPNEEQFGRDTLEAMFADRTYKLQHIIHAEEDALNNIDPLQLGFGLSDATMYIYPCQPCVACAEKIQQAGIKKVVAPIHQSCDATCPTCKGDNFNRYLESFNKTERLFADHGIGIELFPIKELSKFFPTLPDLSISLAPQPSITPNLDAIIASLATETKVAKNEDSATVPKPESAPNLKRHKPNPAM